MQLWGSWLFFPRRMIYLINDFIILTQTCLVGTYKKQVWDGGSCQGGFFPPHCILFSGWSGAWGELWQCWVDLDPKDWKAAKPPVRIHLHAKQSQNELVWIGRFQNETFHMRTFLHISLGVGVIFFPVFILNMRQKHCVEILELKVFWLLV